MSVFRGIFTPRRQRTTLPAAPVVVGSPSDPLDPSLWRFLHSPTMPARPAYPWHFDFPTESVHGVDYVCTPRASVKDGGVMRIRFSIEGRALLKEVDTHLPGMVRLHVQRAGDDMSGEGVHASSRFWSPPLLLTPGAHTLETPIQWEHWTNVWGKKDAAGFSACIGSLQFAGFTFGAQSAGHGVYAAGPVRFHLLEFTA